jgi:adenosylhomocysteine nucleosidase
MKKQILVFALNEEMDPRFENQANLEVLVTGMGKLNAAIKLSQKLETLTDLNNYIIINLGTAGSVKHAVGDLVEIVDFYERAVTFPSTKLQGKKQTELVPAVAGSGDLVEPIDSSKPWDCVDMEAFALARVCKEKSLPFVSIKYITDVSEGNAYKEWKKNLIFAREKLYQYWNDCLKNKSF